MNEKKKTKSAAGRFLSNAIKSTLRFSIPVNRITRPVFSMIYFLHTSIREFISWVCRFVYFEPLFRSHCAYVGKGLWIERLPYIVGRGKILVGNNVRISGLVAIGFSNKINRVPALIIGDNTFIGHNSSFGIAGNITIGKNCLIAGGAQFMDNDGHPTDYIKRREGRPPDESGVRPITIGDDVWIGKGAAIIKGVSIGDRAIVGAHAVVTSDVPADNVVAGNPAKTVKILSLNNLD